MSNIASKLLKSALLLILIFLAMLPAVTADTVYPFKGLDVGYDDYTAVIHFYGNGEDILLFTSYSHKVTEDMFLFDIDYLFGPEYQTYTEQGVEIRTDGTNYLLTSECEERTTQLLLYSSTGELLPEYIDYSKQTCATGVPDVPYTYISATMSYVHPEEIDLTAPELPEDFEYIRLSEFSTEEMSVDEIIYLHPTYEFITLVQPAPRYELNFYTTDEGFARTIFSPDPDLKYLYVLDCTEVNSHCISTVVPDYQPAKQFGLFDIWFYIMLTLFILGIIGFIALGIASRFKKGIKVPAGQRIKTFLALMFSLALVISFYFLFWAIHWLLFLFIGVVPLIIALIWARPKGLELKKSDSPELFKMLDDLAKEIGVRAPHKVLLVAGTEIGVTGVFSKKLLLGMAGLLKLKKDELYAILAHEYAHFRGLDNIIGSGLQYVALSLEGVIRLIAKIPIWPIYIWVLYYFLVIYYYLYSLFILAYSRQREYLADRVAATVVGPKAFGEALNNYSAFAYSFDAVAIKEVVKLAATGKIFKNIYSAHTKFLKAAKKEDVEKLKKAVREREVKGLRALFTTHPPMTKRLKNIKGLPEPKAKLPSGTVLSMIKGIEQKQETLSKMFQETILKKVRIVKKGKKVEVHMK